VAYYSLAVGGVEPQAAPPRVTKGLARHLIPVLVLPRLAVDRAEQRRGLGKGLLKDALRRTAAAADIAGIRALFVTAKDEEARRFCAHYDFDPGPDDPHRLFLVMKDLKRLIEGGKKSSSSAMPARLGAGKTECAAAAFAQRVVCAAAPKFHRPQNWHQSGTNLRHKLKQVSNFRR
jgi:hypothetical protein